MKTKIELIKCNQQKFNLPIYRKIQTSKSTRKIFQNILKIDDKIDKI